MSNDNCTHNDNGVCLVLGLGKCRPVNCSLKGKDNPSPRDIFNEINARRNPQIIAPRKARREDWEQLPENKTLFHGNPGEIIGKRREVSPVEQMERFLAGEPSPDATRKKPGHEESQLQQLCVAWFRSEFPAIAPLLIAVPNAARRNARTGAILKREGLTAGVADLILLVGRGEYHSLCIEMKTHRKGSGQSDKQIEWEQVAEENGNKYVVCRDLEEFKITVLNYLFP